jgi:DNA repair photolyase
MDRTEIRPEGPLLADGQPRRGRGAALNPTGRFEPFQRERVDDGWTRPEEDETGAPMRQLRTVVTRDSSRTIIAHNDSPDIGFDRSINPYRGCEHGCIYCYARPSHAYLGLSPGLDFETRIFAKEDAARLLVAELSRPGYRCAPIAIGMNTDAYQPTERRLKITRSLWEVLSRCNHPATLVTKSELVTRDLDILASMAERRLVRVFVSVTTLDRELARTLEPRAATPPRRVETIRRLAEAGIPTGVMTAPIIPGLTDSEIEAILTAAAQAGALMAGFVLLRLPHELKALFENWLRLHAPLKAERVLALVRETRGGRLNDPNFGSRMRGQGPYAQLIAQRFETACRRLGLNKERAALLDCSRFTPPSRNDERQLSLF